MESPQPPSEPTLSPKTIWVSLIIAGVVPVLAIIALIVLMVATNFNFMDWME